MISRMVQCFSRDFWSVPDNFSGTPGVSIRFKGSLEGFCGILVVFYEFQGCSRGFQSVAEVFLGIYEFPRSVPGDSLEILGDSGGFSVIPGDFSGF